MLNTILENLVTVLKSGETQKFAMESIENIAKLCLTGDIESGVHEIIGGIQYASSIKDILFWSKMKKWLENTYSSPDMEDKISSKFTEDEPKYKEYTMRQIQYIAQVDEEEKICYYANLTRAWLIGSIDTSIYFKLAYLLRVFTLEELEYLKNDYKKEEFEKIDFYIREFSLYGLVDVVHISNGGNSVYKYSDLAKFFVIFSLKYDEGDNLSFENVKLESLEVKNTKSLFEWGRF